MAHFLNHDDIETGLLDLDLGSRASEALTALESAVAKAKSVAANLSTTGYVPDDDGNPGDEVSELLDLLQNCGGEDAIRPVEDAMQQGADLIAEHLGFSDKPVVAFESLAFGGLLAAFPVVDGGEYPEWFLCADCHSELFKACI